MKTPTADKESEIVKTIKVEIFLLLFVLCGILKKI
jgi:hypothetical protein